LSKLLLQGGDIFSYTLIDIYRNKNSHYLATRTQRFFIFRGHSRAGGNPYRGYINHNRPIFHGFFSTKNTEKYDDLTGSAYKNGLLIYQVLAV
jgi:hypothetical protein